MPLLMNDNIRSSTACSTLYGDFDRHDGGKVSVSLSRQIAPFAATRHRAGEGRGHGGGARPAAGPGEADTAGPIGGTTPEAPRAGRYGAASAERDCGSAGEGGRQRVRCLLPHLSTVMKVINQHPRAAAVGGRYAEAGSAPPVS